jgi:hypothetical protein
MTQEENPSDHLQNQEDRKKLPQINSLLPKSLYGVTKIAF